MKPKKCSQPAVHICIVYISYKYSLLRGLNILKLIHQIKWTAYLINIRLKCTYYVFL